MSWVVGLVIKGWWSSYWPQVYMFLNLKVTKVFKTVVGLDFNQLCMQVGILTFHNKYGIVLASLALPFYFSLMLLS